VGERQGEQGALSQLASWLGGLTKTLPAMAQCVRLAVRWCEAHLLTMPTLAVEVSVAAVLSSAPLPPTCPTPAFLLWLHTMASHDWNSSPLVSGGYSEEDAPDRGHLPPFAVLTPHSPAPSYWTKEVTWPQIQRLVSLANEAILNVKSPEAVFTPSLKGYEILIHLKPLMVSNRHLSVYNIFQKGENISGVNDEASSCLPVVDFHPVSRYVEELQTCYSSVGKFFHDKYGGTVIGVKLVKDDDKSKIFKLGCKTIGNASGKLITNWGAIIEDWRILGEGIVKDVEVVNSDLLL